MIKKFFEHSSQSSSQSLDFINDLKDEFEDLEYVEFTIRKVYCTRDLRHMSYADQHGFFPGYRIVIHPKRQEHGGFFSPKQLMEFYQKLYRFEIELKNYFDHVKLESTDIFLVLEKDQSLEIEREVELRGLFYHELPSLIKRVSIRYGKIVDLVYDKSSDSFTIVYEFPVSYVKSSNNLDHIKNIFDSKFPECLIEISPIRGNGIHSHNSKGIRLKFQGIKKDFT